MSGIFFAHRERIDQYHDKYWLVLSSIHTQSGGTINVMAINVTALGAYNGPYTKIFS